MSLSVASIEFEYRKNRPVLRGLSLEAGRGELVSIAGPNGCGKTTFIKCINRVLNAPSGSATLEGRDIFSMHRSDIAREIGYVPQMAHGMMSGTVLDMVILGRKPYIKWRLCESDIDAALAALKQIDMAPLANIPFNDLSGGQKQKVLIARALAQNPAVFLFDEPTSFLDIKNQYEIMNIMRGAVTNEHKIVIMAVHDLNMAMRYSDKVLLLDNGRGVAFGSPHEVLTADNIRLVYGIDVTIIDGRYIVPS
jgi:iron complex transport system ATP-binding protein